MTTTAHKLLLLGQRRGSALVNIIRNPDVTPSEGANLLADPGFEDWDSATDLADWVESLSGTSSVNREDVVVHSGDFAARFDVDGSSSTVQIVQAVPTTLYGWYRFSVWALGTNASQQIRIDAGDTGIASPYASHILQPPTDDYAQYHLTFYAQDTSPTIVGFRRWLNSASQSIYWDDAEFCAVTPGLALYNHVKNCGRFAMAFTREFGTLLGLVINADSDSDPQNYTRVLVGKASTTTSGLGAESVVLESVTNGVPTTIDSYAFTYAPGAPLVVTRYEDGTLDIEYNSVALATGVAGTGHDGTYWGAMNTYAGNSISLLSVDSRDCTME